MPATPPVLLLLISAAAFGDLCTIHLFNAPRIAERPPVLLLLISSAACGDLCASHLFNASRIAVWSSCSSWSLGLSLKVPSARC